MAVSGRRSRCVAHCNSLREHPSTPANHRQGRSGPQGAGHKPRGDGYKQVLEAETPGRPRGLDLRTRASQVQEHWLTSAVADRACTVSCAGPSEVRRQACLGIQSPAWTRLPRSPEPRTEAASSRARDRSAAARSRRGGVSRAVIVDLCPMLRNGTSS